MSAFKLTEIRLRLEELQRGSTDEGAGSGGGEADHRWEWLLQIGEHPEEAAELAELINEVAPALGLHSYKRLPAPHSQKQLRAAQSQERNTRVAERLQAAVPIQTASGQVDWSRLCAAVSSEMLAFTHGEEDSPCADPSSPTVTETASQCKTPTSAVLEINSGGRIFFCLFEPSSRQASAASGATLATSSMPPATEAETALCREPEGVLVLKFVPSRLLCQSEQFANELARHVGIAAPDSRLLRQRGPTEEEWQAALAASERVHDGLHQEMTRCGCILVLEFVPGRELLSSPAAFEGATAIQTFSHLGRLLTLDMLLGNADRLPCDALGWRGNSGNVLFGSAGRWAGLPVAIDAVVQRRPPGGLLSAEDAACERIVELTKNDPTVAGNILMEAIGASPAAVAAFTRCGDEATAAFQAGLHSGLEATSSLKGLLEMMFEKVTDWTAEFIADVTSNSQLSLSLEGHDRHSSTPQCTPRRRSVSHGPSLSGTPGINGEGTTTEMLRAISQEASRNEDVHEQVAGWKALFRARGEELRAAVEEWQSKRSAAGPEELPLTTGFLDGTHPVVDICELKVRLAHMLQRLRVLQQASATGRPTRLMPGVFLSGAVEASSFHLLRHLGVTHILNCTEDLLLPDPARTGFQAVMRIPLNDIEEEDLASHFDPASEFIDAAQLEGGAVLVHCHAGQSRSCSLVLAWLMTRRRWTLRQALEFLHRSRPQAMPNAGYLQCLGSLEAALFGKQTVKVKQRKPEPRRCPECAEAVGLSQESVRVHLRLKHPTQYF